MTCKRIVKKTDVCVIGAGLAGLEAAYEAGMAGAEVVLLNKGAAASPFVLGFNAAVSARDSEEQFFADTCRGGWEIADKGLVRTLARGASDAVKQLEGMGFSFDRESARPDGYHLLSPLGCGVPRLVHAGNETGKRSMRLLREKLVGLGVLIWENCTAIDLLKGQDGVSGVLAVNADEEEARIVWAKAVVLATGGGHLMRGSTYPLCQTADGFAMAYRAGAALVDMEFIQFEPCRAIYPRPLGLSTTLLAKGGILKNSRGERFVLWHYPTEGAAPKDALARLIAVEIAEGRGSEHGGVYLDLTALPQEEIKVNHALYDKRFLAAGLDLTRDIVEVAPAAHSMMGGVKIDETAFTGVLGLYAAGEVTGGLHGANRLGGNAGAETYVFGRIAGKSAARFAASRQAEDPLEKALDAATALRAAGAETADFEDLKAAARALLFQGAGPVRDAGGLAGTLEKIDLLHAKAANAKAETCRAVSERAEALNLLLTGKLVCEAALRREESRGVHYRRDFPFMDDVHWKTSQSLRQPSAGRQVENGARP